MKKLSKRHPLHAAARTLNNIPLRPRIVLLNLIINILLVAVIAFWIGKVSYGQMLEQGAYTLNKGFQQSLSYMDSQLESARNFSDVIIYSAYLNTLINRQSADVLDNTSAARELRLLIRNFEESNNVYHARIYVNDSWDFSVDGRNIFPISQIRDPSLLEKLFSEKGIKLFVGSSRLEDAPAYADQVLSMFRVMYSLNDYSDVSFILRLDLSKQDFIDILSNASPTSGSVSAILDGDGALIAGSPGFTDTLPDTADRSPLSSLPQNQVSDLFLGEERYMAMRGAIPQTDWTVITLVPYASFTMSFREIQHMILTISLLIILVSLFLFSLISYTVTRRISVLCTHITSIQSGRLVPIEAPVYRDEIGLLYQNYNGMISRIKELLKQNYNMGRDLKSAEYKALQSQINPHFLYNTLDMIRWFSLQGRTDEINAVVYSLARFYKISLSRGRDIISIGEEIEHADCYIEIQKHRFRDQICYRKDIDPDILPYSIPKITIQPLIENAILHGLLEKETPGGTVELRGRIENGLIHIAILDNGAGMEPPTGLRPSSPPEKHSSGSHYGLRNILLRLQLLYGPEYGLSIESRPGQGTAVHIHLPARLPAEMEQPGQAQEDEYL